MTGTLQINTQTSSFEGTGSILNVSCPKEFVLIQKKKTTLKKATHFIHSVYKSVEMTISCQKSLVFLHLVSEMRPEHY